MIEPASGIGFVRAVTNLVERLGAGSTVDLQAIGRLADTTNWPRCPNRSTGSWRYYPNGSMTLPLLGSGLVWADL
jgi:hypothetical protein